MPAIAPKQDSSALPPCPTEDTGVEFSGTRFESLHIDIDSLAKQPFNDAVARGLVEVLFTVFHYQLKKCWTQTHRDMRCSGLSVERWTPTRIVVQVLIVGEVVFTSRNLRLPFLRLGDCDPPQRREVPLLFSDSRCCVGLDLWRSPLPCPFGSLLTCLIRNTCKVEVQRHATISPSFSRKRRMTDPSVTRSGSILTSSSSNASRTSSARLIHSDQSSSLFSIPFSGNS